MQILHIIQPWLFIPLFQVHVAFFSGKEDSEGEIGGYVHNVSPIGQGQSEEYFDFHLQTESNVICVVCFSPFTRRALDESSLKRSRVMIKRFLPNIKENSTDMLMNGKVIVQELQSSSVARKDLPPEQLKAAKVTSIFPEQMIILKAKVVSLENCKIRTNSDSPLSRRGVL